MAWVKVPAEHRPIFIDALPKDPRIERINMFGGIAAKVNGHFFAGLFGRSTLARWKTSGLRAPRATAVSSARRASS